MDVFCTSDREKYKSSDHAVLLSGPVTWNTLPMTVCNLTHSITVFHSDAESQTRYQGIPPAVPS